MYVQSTFLLDLLVQRIDIIRMQHDVNLRDHTTHNIAKESGELQKLRDWHSW